MLLTIFRKILKPKVFIFFPKYFRGFLTKILVLKNNNFKQLHYYKRSCHCSQNTKYPCPHPTHFITYISKSSNSCFLFFSFSHYYLSNIYSSHHSHRLRGWLRVLFSTIPLFLRKNPRFIFKKRFEY